MNFTDLLKLVSFFIGDQTNEKHVRSRHSSKEKDEAGKKGNLKVDVCWESFSTSSNKNNTILNENVKTNLIEEFQNFIDNETFFNEKKVPFKNFLYYMVCLDLEKHKQSKR